MARRRCDEDDAVNHGPVDLSAPGDGATPDEAALWAAVLFQSWQDAFSPAKPIGCDDKSPAFIAKVRAEALAFLCGVGDWRSSLEQAADFAGCDPDDIARRARREAARLGIAIPSALRYGKPATIEDLTEAEQRHAEKTAADKAALMARVEVLRAFEATDSLVTIRDAFGWSQEQATATARKARKSTYPSVVCTVLGVGKQSYGQGCSRPVDGTE